MNFESSELRLLYDVNRFIPALYGQPFFFLVHATTISIYKSILIDSSSCGCSFLFWTFHIWYRVISNTCYRFPPLFIFFWFSHVAINFPFTSESSPILMLLKRFPSNATKKKLVKIVQHKLDEAFSDSIRGDVQLGRFFLLSFSISEQLPRPTSLYFFTFLKWPLKLHCTFRWQQSGGFEQ